MLACSLHHLVGSFSRSFDTLINQREVGRMGQTGSRSHQLEPKGEQLSFKSLQRKNPIVSRRRCCFTADLSCAPRRQRPHASRMRLKPQEELMSSEGESINMFQKVKHEQGSGLINVDAVASTRTRHVCTTAIVLRTFIQMV